MMGAPRRTRRLTTPFTPTHRLRWQDVVISCASLLARHILLALACQPIEHPFHDSIVNTAHIIAPYETVPSGETDANDMTHKRKAALDFLRLKGVGAA